MSRCSQDVGASGSSTAAAGGSLSRGSVLSTSSSLGGAGGGLPPNKQQSSTALASLAGLLGGTDASGGTLQGSSGRPPRGAGTLLRNQELSRSRERDMAAADLLYPQREIMQESSYILQQQQRRPTHYFMHQAQQRTTQMGVVNAENCRKVWQKYEADQEELAMKAARYEAGLGGDNSTSLPGLLSAGTLSTCRSRQWDSSGRVGRSDAAWLSNFGGSYRDSRPPPSSNDKSYQDTDNSFNREEFSKEIRDGTRDCVREYRELGRQRERREVRAQRRERAREATKDLYFKQSDRRKRSDKSQSEAAENVQDQAVSLTNKLPSKTGCHIRFLENDRENFTDHTDTDSPSRNDSSRLSGDGYALYKINNAAGECLVDAVLSDSASDPMTSPFHNLTGASIPPQQDTVAPHTLLGEASNSSLNVSSSLIAQHPSLTTAAPFLTPHSPNVNAFTFSSHSHDPSPQFSSSGATSLPLTSNDNNMIPLPVAPGGGNRSSNCSPSFSKRSAASLSTPSMNFTSPEQQQQQQQQEHSIVEGTIQLLRTSGSSDVNRESKCSSDVGGSISMWLPQELSGRRSRHTSGGSDKSAPPSNISSQDTLPCIDNSRNSSSPARQEDCTDSYDFRPRPVDYLERAYNVAINQNTDRMKVCVLLTKNSLNLCLTNGGNSGGLIPMQLYYNI